MQETVNRIERNSDGVGNDRLGLSRRRCRVVVVLVKDRGREDARRGIARRGDGCEGRSCERNLQDCSRDEHFRKERKPAGRWDTCLKPSFL